jgi:glycosyltransferase involved in cell wall biosynthesis
VPRVSVIVPSYRGHERVTGCLDSLAAQTASPADVEAIVVQNGPQTGTREVVAAWREAHPGFDLVYLETDVASVTHARNLALDAATAEYVTFVDDDDRVAPRFVETLLGSAAPDAVATTMGLVVHDGDFDRPVATYAAYGRFRELAGATYTNADVEAVLQPVWGKIVSTEVARAVRFDDRLARFADDTVFWLRCVIGHGLRIVLTEMADDAAYLYWERTGSIMRPDAGPTWETHVAPQLVVMTILNELDILDSPDYGVCGRALAAYAGSRVSAYVTAHPADAPRVADELRAIGWLD